MVAGQFCGPFQESFCSVFRILSKRRVVRPTRLTVLLRHASLVPASVSDLWVATPFNKGNNKKNFTRNGSIRFNKNFYICIF